MPVRHIARTIFRFILLAACCALTACSSTADHLVKRGPEGAVILERLPARGTTVRYSSRTKLGAIFTSHGTMLKTVASKAAAS